MKKIVYFLLILVFAGCCFLAGLFVSNKENYDIEKSWNTLEKSFVKLDADSLVKNTNVNIVADVKNKFNTIVVDYDIQEIEKVEQYVVITKSYAVLEQNNNADSKYAIIRVYFTYKDSAEAQQSKFLYFYLYKTNNSKFFTKWSLFNIETESSVTVK